MRVYSSAQVTEKPAHRLQAKDKSSSSYQDPTTLRRDSSREFRPSRRPSKNPSRRLGRCLCCSYVAFRIVYCLAFTFTSFYIFMLILIEADLATLSRVEALQAEKQNLTVALDLSAEQHGTNELTRQQELVTSMQNACNNYIGELFDSVAIRLDQIFSGELRRQIRSRSNSSIGAILHEKMLDRMRRYAADLEAFRLDYRDRVTTVLIPTTVGYRNYLELVYQNDWLNFPQRLFNESVGPEDQIANALRNECNFSGKAIDFANFLEIQEVHEVQFWSSQFWQR